MGQQHVLLIRCLVVNAFLELGLPFILRFVKDLRAGKTTVKETVAKVEGKETTPPIRNEQDEEKCFMDKVERELGLPDYNLFSMSLIRLRWPSPDMNS